MAFMASGGYKGIGAQVPDVKVCSVMLSSFLSLLTCCGHVALPWSARRAWQGRTAAAW